MFPPVQHLQPAVYINSRVTDIFTFSCVDSPTIGLHMLKQSKYFIFWTVGLVRMLYFTCNGHRNIRVCHADTYCLRLKEILEYNTFKSKKSSWL